MNKRIVVLASNSFSGADFVDLCLTKNCEVLGFSRSKEPSDIFLSYKQNLNYDNFHFTQANLNTDIDKMISQMKEFKPDIIVDYAGQGMVAPSWTHPEQWYQTNIVAKVKLHNEVRKQVPSLKCYLRFSTPEVYGSTSGKINEDAPLNPSTPYAVSHAAQDMSLKAFYNNYQFPVIFTRAANVYGPHQQLYRIIPRTIIFSRIGKKLKLDGGGHSIRNFIHIRDTSNALWKLIDNPKPGEAYHLVSDEYISIRNLVERVCKVTGVKFEDLVEVGEDRLGKDKAYYLDDRKIQIEYNWKSEISLDEGIRQTVQWIDTHLDEIKKLPLDYIHKE